MDQLQELEETFIEEYEAAILLVAQTKKKAALILLSKALFALVDYILFKKYKQLPKNHTERFRILEIKEKVLYEQVDAVWSKYTDTYAKPTQDHALVLLKKTIEDIVYGNEKISQKIAEAVKTE